MPIEIDAQCYLCHFKRSLERALALGDMEQATAFSKDLLKMYASAPEGISSPWFGPGVAQLYQKHYGLELDRYRQEKIESNRFVLARLEQLRQQIAKAPDPVYAALQFATLGNYIDFAALQDKVSFQDLDEMIRKAESMALDRDAYAALRRELEAGTQLLYLTDNAGEIGFDRLLAETLQDAYPHLSITFCVRGGPAQNDATREDAEAVGIPFPVIDNGNTVAGTQLDQLSPEAKAAMDSAHVIIAKGMGNAETLLGCGYPIYYLFLVKCPRFVDYFQKPMFTPMLIREA